MSKRFLSRRVSDAGVGFPTGTAMLFQQTLAAPGWVKSATHDDKALRVVSGTASSGGSSPFSTVHGLTATDTFTLLDTHLSSHTHTGPSHTHTRNLAISDLGSGIARDLWGGVSSFAPGTQVDNIDDLAMSANNAGGTGATGSTGGDTGHSHPVELRINYVDVILCIKS